MTSVRAPPVLLLVVLLLAPPPPDDDELFELLPHALSATTATSARSIEPNGFVCLTARSSSYDVVGPGGNLPS
jgi:hypothetical protein